MPNRQERLLPPKTPRDLLESKRMEGLEALNSLAEKELRHELQRSESDWLEAFEAHPQIGDKEALRDKFAESRSGWESEEQAGASGASEAVLDELADLNSVYRSRNGFVFLICATGKTAEEILDRLKLRLSNDRDTEIKTAAEEQRKICQLRFTKLLEGMTQKRGQALDCTDNALHGSSTSHL